MSNLVLGTFASVHCWQHQRSSLYPPSPVSSEEGDSDAIPSANEQRKMSNSIRGWTLDNSVKENAEIIVVPNLRQIDRPYASDNFLLIHPWVGEYAHSPWS